MRVRYRTCDICRAEKEETAKQSTEHEYINETNREVVHVTFNFLRNDNDNGLRLQMSPPFLYYREEQRLQMPLPFLVVHYLIMYQSPQVVWLHKSWKRRKYISKNLQKAIHMYGWKLLSRIIPRYCEFVGKDDNFSHICLLNELYLING